MINDFDRRSLPEYKKYAYTNFLKVQTWKDFFHSIHLTGFLQVHVTISKVSVIAIPYRAGLVSQLMPILSVYPQPHAN